MRFSDVTLYYTTWLDAAQSCFKLLEDILNFHELLLVVDGRIGQYGVDEIVLSGT